MKNTLTIAFALIVSASFAQKKDLQGTATTMQIDTNQLGSYGYNEVVKVIKRDTQSVWFKESVIQLCRCLGKGDTVIEHWRHGWIVINTMSNYYWDGDRRHNVKEDGDYLYSDRKTKVTNHILYSITSK